MASESTRTAPGPRPGKRPRSRGDVALLSSGASLSVSGVRKRMRARASEGAARAGGGAVKVGAGAVDVVVAAAARMAAALVDASMGTAERRHARVPRARETLEVHAPGTAKGVRRAPLLPVRASDVADTALASDMPGASAAAAEASRVARSDGKGTRACVHRALVDAVAPRSRAP